MPSPSRDCQSSPRSWGCFSCSVARVRALAVFPTLVGVFLSSCHFLPWSQSLPHARGGVSKAIQEKLYLSLSSPRSWGCFWTLGRRCLCYGVFPTLVGVFPSRGRPPLEEGSLPHARGGVSLMSLDKLCPPRSSPRSWGCFLARAPDDTASKVFPTLVGVLPRQSPAWGTIRSKWELLHVLCPYSKEINANGTLLKRRKKASYRANFLLIVPMLYRFKKYF